MSCKIIRDIIPIASIKYIAPKDLKNDCAHKNWLYNETENRRAMVRVPTNHFHINDLAIILKMEYFKEKRKPFIEIGNVYSRDQLITDKTCLDDKCLKHIMDVF